MVDGIAEVGAVYLPISNELFAASRGGGATLNGKPIHVSQEATLNRGLLATGFPYDVRERTDEILAYLKQFLRQAQGVRLRRTAPSCDDFEPKCVQTRATSNSRAIR